MAAVRKPRSRRGPMVRPCTQLDTQDVRERVEQLLRPLSRPRYSPSSFSTSLACRATPAPDAAGGWRFRLRSARRAGYGSNVSSHTIGSGAGPAGGWSASSQSRSHRRTVVAGGGHDAPAGRPRRPPPRPCPRGRGTSAGSRRWSRPTRRRCPRNPATATRPSGLRATHSAPASGPTSDRTRSPVPASHRVSTSSGGSGRAQRGPGVSSGTGRPARAGRPPPPPRPGCAPASGGYGRWRSPEPAPPRCQSTAANQEPSADGATRRHPARAGRRKWPAVRPVAASQRRTDWSPCTVNSVRPSPLTRDSLTPTAAAGSAAFPRRTGRTASVPGGEPEGPADHAGRGETTCRHRGPAPPAAARRGFRSRQRSGRAVPQLEAQVLGDEQPSAVAAHRQVADARGGQRVGPPAAAEPAAGRCADSSAHTARASARRSEPGCRRAARTWSAAVRQSWRAIASRAAARAASHASSAATTASLRRATHTAGGAV